MGKTPNIENTLFLDIFDFVVHVLFRFRKDIDNDRVYKYVQSVYRTASSEMTDEQKKSLSTLITSNDETYMGIFLRCLSQVMQDGRITQADAVHVIAMIHDLTERINDTHQTGSIVSVDGAAVLQLVRVIVVCVVALLVEKEGGDVAAVRTTIDAIFALIELRVDPVKKKSALSCLFSFFK